MPQPCSYCHIHHHGTCEEPHVSREDADRNGTANPLPADCYCAQQCPHCNIHHHGVCAQGNP